MIKKSTSFIKSHNLVNRIYDMLIYFDFIKKPDSESIVKKFLKEKLNNSEYVESIAKYFEKKLKKYYNNVEVRCNLNDLINDLNYLKQYIF